MDGIVLKEGNCQDEMFFQILYGFALSVIVFTGFHVLFKKCSTITTATDNSSQCQVTYTVNQPITKNWRISLEKINLHFITVAKL